MSLCWDTTEEAAWDWAYYARPVPTAPAPRFLLAAVGEATGEPITRQALLLWLCDHCTSLPEVLAEGRAMWGEALPVEEIEAQAMILAEGLLRRWLAGNVATR